MLKTISSTSYNRFFLALSTNLAKQGTSMGLRPKVRFSTRQEHHIQNALLVIVFGALLAIAIIIAFLLFL